MKRRWLMAATLFVLLALLFKGFLAWPGRLTPVERQIVGRWENRAAAESNRAIFSPDHRFLTDNQTGTWRVRDGVLFLQYDGNGWRDLLADLVGQGTLSDRFFIVSLQSDQLKLRSSGGTAVFILTRVVAEADAR